ncbi:Major facilitator superfamily domain-containing protein 4-B [Oryzias melastigma]|uniref:Major facilitator superfamily domain-containing protein 4-B n=1 Tax=Oryzias melastigma TaxID=30732 RepID=A0A834C9A6_ORYME|nr:Major facilitator superfamily domain-containing protein 4-B [Oryzias melastigma]
MSSVCVFCWQLPVPAAVLMLMLHERLLPCSSNSPRLLEKDGPKSCPMEADSQGHGSVFSCCNSAKLEGQPTTTFFIYAVGGAIVFITDGIIVSTSSCLITCSSVFLL